MSGAEPLRFVPTLPAEELGRAHFYALIARLFYAPPDAALLERLAHAEPLQAESGDIASAWQALCRAAAAAEPEAVREEYDAAFIGTGKAPVTLYTCAYTIQYSNEAPLAELRGELAAFGLARRDGAFEPEDHIAALCDTMRHLIAEQKRALPEQRRFFQRWIGPAYARLCDAIDRAPNIVFYKSVARFANAFLTLEQLAFEML
jgi:TorA maturation chaperone TorD